MIPLPKPGVYVVRAKHADYLSEKLVAHWLNSQADSAFKSCLWLTACPPNKVRHMLDTHWPQCALPQGLNVVSVRNLLKKTPHQHSIQKLCRSLNTLCILKPSLVIIEHAELWFNGHNEELNKRNPMAQMRLFHQWAVHAQASVVTTIQGDLPEWSAFADGLADVSEQGEFEFYPWWPTPWGLQTHLWKSPANTTPLPIQCTLDSHLFDNLKHLAQTCHQLRFADQTTRNIHIQAHGELSAQDACVLLRMGADSVTLNDNKEKIYQALLSELPESAQSINFARDLHEAFMPGSLTLIPNTRFAIDGLMMLQVTQKWHMHCTITRLSLMGHINAHTALRLANWPQATGLFTSTHEAIYILKIWAQAPHEADYRQWLESCFKEELSTLFSGDIQFTDLKTQTELLTNLHQEPEIHSLQDLLAGDTPESIQLTELWDESTQTSPASRPWTQRLTQIFNTNAT